MTEFLTEVLLDGLLDVLKLLPFLFLTYLCMEYVEHKTAGGAERFVKRSGKFGPLVGGVAGVLPQCGFSASAANFFAGKMISAGTLVAVFLSTSDEMLPVMIAGKARPGVILFTLALKMCVGILVGFGVDILLCVLHKEERADVEDLCEAEGCHCERGILHSALHHTVHITVFVLLITLVINAVIFFLGEEAIGAFLSKIPVLSTLLCTFVGLIPNCAASIALTDFYLEGLISLGSMIAGLLPGAGVGLLVLFRMNRGRMKENLLILALLVAVGFGFGLLVDAIGLGALLN